MKQVLKKKALNQFKKAAGMLKKVITKLWESKYYHGFLGRELEMEEKSLYYLGTPKLYFVRIQSETMKSSKTKELIVYGRVLINFVN